jgi:hypothetical protein
MRRVSRSHLAIRPPSTSLTAKERELNQGGGPTRDGEMLELGETFQEDCTAEGLHTIRKPGLFRFSNFLDTLCYSIPADRPAVGSDFSQRRFARETSCDGLELGNFRHRFASPLSYVPQCSSLNVCHAFSARATATTRRRKNSTFSCFLWTRSLRTSHMLSSQA